MERLEAGSLSLEDSLRAFEEGVGLSRRGAAILRRLSAFPASLWRQAVIDTAHRRHQRIRYLDETVQLPGYKGSLRQLAVTGLARTLANEYGPYGITVNNVCPGYTKTDRLSELSDAISARTGAKPEEVVAGWERQIPAGRLGKPEEFAAVVTFLASERASYVNGTSIAIDGGIVRSLL